MNKFWWFNIFLIVVSGVIGYCALQIQTPTLVISFLLLQLSLVVMTIFRFLFFNNHKEDDQKANKSATVIQLAWIISAIKTIFLITGFYTTHIALHSLNLYIFIIAATFIIPLVTFVPFIINHASNYEKEKSQYYKSRNYGEARALARGKFYNEPIKTAKPSENPAIKKQPDKKNIKKAKASNAYCCKFYAYNQEKQELNKENKQHKQNKRKRKKACYRNE